MKTKKLKNSISAIVLVLFTLVAIGCGGRSASPIASKDVGDSKMSCYEIEAELSDLDVKARRLLGEQSDKKGSNAAIFLGGLILFPVWFFADLSDAERIEAEAMQDRGRHLQKIANKKKCNFI